MTRTIGRTVSIAAAVLALVLSACPKETELVRVVEPWDRAGTQVWVGCSEQDLIEVWGTPQSRESDGEGGEILVYERVRFTVESDETHPITVEGSARSNIDEHFQHEEKKTTGRFWVARDGKIYRFEVGSPKLLLEKKPDRACGRNGD